MGTVDKIFGTGEVVGQDAKNWLREHPGSILYANGVCAVITNKSSIIEVDVGAGIGAK